MAPDLVPGRVNIALGGNANSLHAPGRAAFEAMEQARRSVAADLNASRPNEVIFTSGATESDNAALLGVAVAAADARRCASGKSVSDFTPHFITTSIEHEAVLAPAHLLERMGVQLTVLKPDRAGFVGARQVEEALRPNTVLVSVMLANNEVGSVQPLEEIVGVAHAMDVLVHTDAVQALGKIPIDLHSLGVDAASFSAHKICGPKGMGALYLAKGTPCDPFMLGGGQESGFRSGTQNVAGMVGFAAAAQRMCDPDALRCEAARLGALRDSLYEHLCSIKGVRKSVPCEAGSTGYLPNIANFVVEGVESETMILRLDRRGIMVSGGSACSSKDLSPNRILTQLGFDRDSALCSLRVSMGPLTTEDDIREFEGHFKDMVEWARS